jgi:hypothetical protein
MADGLPEAEARRRATVTVGNVTRLRRRRAPCGDFARLTVWFRTVTAYLVAQRTHEFGVRVALGAGRGTLLRLVLRQGPVPVVSGICLGLLASVALTRLLRSMLFEVGTLDASVFAAVSLSLALVSALATAIPAPPRRACRSGGSPAMRMRFRRRRP